MARKYFRIMVTTICCLSVLYTSIFAIDFSNSRASDQIISYYIEVSTDPGRINVEFSVTGKGRVDKIGCESIYVYANQNSKWRLVEAWVEDDEGMSNSNTVGHSNVIFCNGTAGVEYKVVATIFSENSLGRDTRSETTYVTGE
ncbi:hypothetical protein WKS99_00975 [Flintibacter sp. HCN-6482]|uniref:hypothetical protein n=1 Tax=Flintibacter sp. HCN-6482 TaxID=3134672 RepID=UPI0030BF3717